MADNPESNNLENDVQIIRQILFGEQLQEFLERLKVLESQVQSLEKENRRLEKQIGSVASNLKKGLESEGKNTDVLATRLESMVAGLEERLVSETQSLRKTLNTYKRTVGGKFSRLEKNTEAKFSQIHDHQDNLVSSLAGALLATRREPEAADLDGD